MMLWVKFEYGPTLFYFFYHLSELRHYLNLILLPPTLLDQIKKYYNKNLSTLRKM